MIGCLTGTVRALDAPVVLLDVNGVGYEVDTPLTTFCQLKKDQKVTLWTHMVVREDAQLLYGFLHHDDKTLFKTVLKVNGVGAKMALGILSTMSVSALIHAIDTQDITGLTRIPGVGKKTAERLVIELRDKLKHLNTAATTDLLQDDTVQSAPVVAHSAIAEAEAALVSLGYKPIEAQKAVGAFKSQFSDTASLIRAALKSMMKQ